MLDRIDINIIKIPIHSDKYEYQGTIKIFNKLKIAKLNEVIEGFYTKVENLKVNGYPAFRVIHESNSMRNKPSLSDTGKRPPPSYDVIIYFRRGKDIWEVRSIAFTKEQQEKTTEILETVLKSLKLQQRRSDK